MFNDPIVNKLILLFVLEKMEIPLSEESLLNVCSSYNKWIPYINCRQAIFELIEVGFIQPTRKGKEANYKLTNDGINCLSKFFTRIPSSYRKEITEYCRDNMLDLKRSQEFKADYFQNADGSSSSNSMFKQETTQKEFIKNGEIKPFRYMR